MGESTSDENVDFTELSLLYSIVSTGTPDPLLPHVKWGSE
jgi:hypothetical protein